MNATRGLVLWTEVCGPSHKHVTNLNVIERNIFEFKFK